jgi:hypothetical protein
VVVSEVNFVNQEKIETEQSSSVNIVSPSDDSQEFQENAAKIEKEAYLRSDYYKGFAEGHYELKYYKKALEDAIEKM